jgi:hypothetical protein
VADLRVDRVVLKCKYPVIEFAQLIAKIGYGYAVGKLGLQQIKNPLVLPAIRGLTRDVGHWVGCIPGAPKEFKPDTLHAAAVVTNNGMLMAMVSLFALQPAPLYSVLLSKGV